MTTKNKAFPSDQQKKVDRRCQIYFISQISEIHHFSLADVLQINYQHYTLRYKTFGNSAFLSID